jgi:hypothetical protein
MKGMNEKFQMTVDKGQNQLHLDLAGDFDEDSARQVTDVLKEHTGARVVYIHTDGLGEVSPSGRRTFQGGLRRMHRFRYRLVFFGDNAAELAPEGGYYF